MAQAEIIDKFETYRAPDAVLTQVSRFHVRPELEAHKRPPTQDTHTRVAVGFSTTDIRTMNFILRHKYRVQGIHHHWYYYIISGVIDPIVHHATSGRHTRPSMIKIQMALERAAHKHVHPRIVGTQL